LSGREARKRKALSSGRSSLFGSKRPEAEVHNDGANRLFNWPKPTFNVRSKLFNLENRGVVK
jgi:hypothetical protein